MGSFTFMIDACLNFLVEIFLNSVWVCECVCMCNWVCGTCLHMEKVCGEVIKVCLKTEAWEKAIDREVKLCAANTGALYNAFTNSLLGDDFSIPSMEFDMDDEGISFIFHIVLACY